MSEAAGLATMSHPRPEPTLQSVSLPGPSAENDDGSDGQEARPGRLQEGPRKKNVHSARMRLHNGNIPTIPQTKLCPLCDAKFTRTTHLNRHMRTHSEDRAYRCEVCQAQFTRSDLLNRHKKTCGDPDLANKSRRKSCQSCAASKVKCDLQVPCSKCKARNRECIYVAGHRGSVSTARSETSPSQDRSSTELPSGASSSSIARRTSSEDHSAAATYPLDSLSQRPSDGNVASHPLEQRPYRVGSTDDSVALVPPTQAADPRVSMHHAYFDNIWQSEIFGDLVGNIFPNDRMQVSAPDNVDLNGHDVVDVRMEGHGPQIANASTDGTILYSADPEDFEEFLRSLNAPSPMSTTGHSPPADRTTATNGPSPAELQHYLSLFFSSFNKNAPLVHEATFSVERVPSVLLAAMRACGALYVRTKIALTFIDATLITVRDELMAEFAKDPTDWEHQIHLALALSLIQTIGLFHQHPEQRVFSTVYHGMLIMMIRMNGFVDRCCSSVLPDPTRCPSADSAWREWAKQETAKRALVWSYLHDCCHCIYYDLRGTFSSAEFDVRLPCEEALWNATSADAWYSVLRQPSPYGGAIERLTGLFLQETTKRIADASLFPSAPPVMMNPFGLLVIMHAILRRLTEELLDCPPLDAATAERTTAVYDGKVLAIQFALQAWFQSCKHSPDTPLNGPGQDPPFFKQVLPFYWLAQLAILAYYRRLPPFGPGTARSVTGDQKFRLVKRWERYARKFLRKDEQEPTMLLHELINHHLEACKAGMTGGVADQDEEENIHLLGFFPEP